MRQNVLAFLIDNGPSERKIPFVKSKKVETKEKSSMASQSKKLAPIALVVIASTLPFLFRSAPLRAQPVNTIQNSVADAEPLLMDSGAVALWQWARLIPTMKMAAC